MQNTKFRRCHYKVWMPENLSQMVYNYTKNIPFIDTTTHAAKEMLNDPRGVIPLPSKMEMFHAHNKIVEIYEILKENNPTGVIQKALIRIPNLSSKYDYAYVLARDGFIVSSWAIDKGDNHRIIKAFENYYCPFEMRDRVKKRLLNEQKKFRYRNVKETNNP